MNQIFPIEGLEPQNPLAAERTHVLPGELGAARVSWTVESAGGTERFLLLALPTEHTFDRTDWNLERRVNAPPSALADPEGTRGLSTDPASGAVPAEALGTHTLSVFELLRERVEQLGSGWVRLVQFESSTSRSGQGRPASAHGAR